MISQSKLSESEDMLVIAQGIDAKPLRLVDKLS